MLDFQLSTVIFTVLNLLILYVVLRKLLFGRVNRILEERAALVEKELSSAERQKAQAEEMRKEYEDQLAQAHAQAAKIVDQAKARGEQEYQAILDQAQEDTRRMQELLGYKNIPAWIDYWGGDAVHDWPWWRKQFPYFISRLC